MLAGGFVHEVISCMLYLLSLFLEIQLIPSHKFLEQQVNRVLVYSLLSNQYYHITM